MLCQVWTLRRCSVPWSHTFLTSTLAHTLQVVLVALPGVDIEALQREVEKQCAALPRNETARKALSHSYVVKVRGSAGERKVCG